MGYINWNCNCSDICCDINLDTASEFCWLLLLIILAPYLSIGISWFIPYTGSVEITRLRARTWLCALKQVQVQRAILFIKLRKKKFNQTYLRSKWATNILSIVTTFFYSDLWKRRINLTQTSTWSLRKAPNNSYDCGKIRFRTTKRRKGCFCI